MPAAAAIPIADAPVATVQTWAVAAITGARQFQFRRPDGLDYWREFLATVQGMRAPFLASTYRRDLDPAPGNVPGVSLLVRGLSYLDLFPHDRYKRLQIETSAGTQNVKVLAATPEGNNTRLTLDTATAAIDFERVSFLNVVRLANDTITFEHSQLVTTLTLQLRTIDE